MMDIAISKFNYFIKSGHGDIVAKLIIKLIFDLSKIVLLYAFNYF